MTDNFQTITEAYNKWLEANLELAGNVKIEDLREKNEGRGVVATRDINEDEVLFSIPRNNVLNIQTSSLANVKEGNGVILKNLNHWEGLILCLAYERSLGDSSRWKGYLDTLPTSFNNLIFWNEEDLNSLKPSLILDRIGSAEAEAMYDRLFPKVVEELGVSEELKNVNLKEFHKVASTIMSYSFDVEEEGEDEEDEEGKEEDDEIDDEEEGEENQNNDSGAEDGNTENNHSENENDDEDEEKVFEFEDHLLKSMVPFADTLNADTNLCNANLTYQSENLVMKAIKPIRKGEQVYNTYGNHPNSEILRRYGYVEWTGSKFDFAEILLSQIENYFISTYSVEKDSLKLIVKIIADSDYLLHLTGGDGSIVVDSYDFYKDGEILPEFLMLVTLLTSICLCKAEDLKWFKKTIRISKRNPAGSELSRFINRTCKKCYQLLEQNIITESVKENIGRILDLRLKEYPDEIKELMGQELAVPKKKNREAMAETVLVCEYKALWACRDEGLKSFKVIQDEKLIKNIMKRKLEEEEGSKRNKRIKG
ncbi:BA75_02653T0 [Komagataella pastoris]|uniref:Ribosomal lysine N-methyltransferase 4 n=1 Tax=Komagataella pastoris TaxID=4922 RepID=A0A1B2JCA3_PICPA|nr:BA75_02653T0 [Komagataella pastoris]